MQLNLRKAFTEDKAKVLEVESKSTPNLKYLPYLYDDWINDKNGDLSVVELDGEIIGVGKYSKLPDGSAWLEALRVTPERQGIGAGKTLYNHWFNLAHMQKVKKMRMYTGISNVKSKGLAERYGLRVEGTYKEALMPIEGIDNFSESSKFVQVTDPIKATKLLMRTSEKWGEFLVMNRTFYQMNPSTCSFLSDQGMIYEESESGSIMTLGSRFMPWQSLHIGIIQGDYEACLNFSLFKGLEKKVKQLSILYQATDSNIEKILINYGFKCSQQNLVTMGVSL